MFLYKESKCLCQFFLCDWFDQIEKRRDFIASHRIIRGYGDKNQIRRDAAFAQLTGKFISIFIFNVNIKKNQIKTDTIQKFFHKRNSIVKNVDRDLDIQSGNSL